jgi:hypothetical protein
MSWKTRVFNFFALAWAWMADHPGFVFIAGGLLFILLWTFGAGLKERWDRWRYIEKIETIERQVEVNEKKADEANAQAEVINQEAERLRKEYEKFKLETERLRRAIEVKERRIVELRNRVARAGIVDSGPTASDRNLCSRANELGVRCDLRAFPEPKPDTKSS